MREAIKPANAGRIHTFLATSDIHLESKFADPRYGSTLEEKRETVLRMAVEPAVQQGLLEPVGPDRWRSTAQGFRFLNDLQALFLPSENS